MRNFISGLMVGIILFASSGIAWGAQKTVKFTVRGLSCSTDEVCVSKKLKALTGVTDSSVDGIDSSVIATFDDEKISAETIKKAIEEEGYDVDKVQAIPDR